MISCRKLILLVTLVSAAGLPLQAFGDPFRPAAITTEGVPDLSPELVAELGRYQEVRSASFEGWAPDGAGILIGTRFGNTTQLHRVFEPGGRREQVTFFDEPVGGRFLPGAGDNTLLATLSRGGDENYQVYRLDLAPRQTTLLTDGKSRNLLGPVRDDGSAMIILSNKRNGRDTDLYLVDPRNPERFDLLYQADGEYWTALDWSPDGTKLMMLRYVSVNESYPAILDVKTGEKTDLPQPARQKVSYAAGAFAADGGSVYLASDAEGEFHTLARVDLDDFATTWLTKDIPWDVTDIEVHRKSGAVVFATNEDGASGLYSLDGNKHRKLKVPLGVLGGLEISPAGTHVGFSLDQPTAPTDAYSLDLKSGELTRWTYSEVGDLDPSTFVRPEQIEFTSFDGRRIPAYYFRAPGASADKPAPVLVAIHGGPESQYRPYFSATDQFLLHELGIAVIRPNVRGSAGYGKTYVALDNAMKREESVRDIGALLDWIAKQPELDETRVAVMGGSYGGYMVLASLTHFSDRLRAGIDIVGIASFQSFLENTSPYRQDLRRAEYGDERDPQMQAFFRRIDPLKNADKIRTSLMVAHGSNDPRVPFSEAEQIAPIVRAGGQEVWTVYANNEGHGFNKKENRDYLSAVTVAFLRKRLQGE